MKDYIIQALDKAVLELDERVPQTKKKLVYVNIDGISPLDIPRFMLENNIPIEAQFGGKPNGYDSFDEICLCYDIDVPTTEKEKLKFKSDRFTTIAYKYVFELLTKNGYKRNIFNSRYSARSASEFDDTTVYDMYIDKDFDKLVMYYSFSFIKIN